MPRRAKGISAAKVSKARPGRYGDGGGLYLLVRSPEAKFWVFRYVRNGTMREMGLGPAAGRAAVALADARARARALYDAHKAGRDPLDDRDAARAQEAMEKAKKMTFADAAAACVEAHRAEWRNARHAAQWASTLKTYAMPVIGEVPVQSIDTGMVLKILEPIWTKKTVTAKRVRGRVETVLNWAKARGYREGENPALWRGHLDKLLAKPSKVRRVKHHVALPYTELGDFMAALRMRGGLAARALDFAVVTAARTGEVLGATWDEINLKEKVWIVPAERMKAGREHRVPLSPRAIEILGELRRDGGRVFPLSKAALLLTLRRMGRTDITAHGFRSAFRDWCAERTNFSREAAEMALGHTIKSETEAAYRRSDLLDKRRQLMDAWALFCSEPPSDGAKVVSLRG